MDSQFLKAKAKSRESLPCQEDSDRKKTQQNKRMPIVVKFHPALSGLGKIIESLWPILHASEDMNKFLLKDLCKSSRGLRGHLITNIPNVMVLVCNTMIDEKI